MYRFVHFFCCTPFGDLDMVIWYFFFSSLWMVSLIKHCSMWLLNIIKIKILVKILKSLQRVFLINLKINTFIELIYFVYDVRTKVKFHKEKKIFNSFDVTTQRSLEILYSNLSSIPKSDGNSYFGNYKYMNYNRIPTKNLKINVIMICTSH